MTTIGITGNWASGKTTVLELCKKRGAHCVNVDNLVHACYRNKKSTVYKKVKKVFPECVSKRGTIDVKKLAAIVFADKKRLCTLERTVHPVVIKELKRQIGLRSKKQGLLCAEVPLLFEKKLEHLFDKTVFVYAPRSVLQHRLKLQGRSDREIRDRLSLFGDTKKKKQKADFSINNNGGLRELKNKVERLLISLKKEYTNG